MNAYQKVATLLLRLVGLVVLVIGAAGICWVGLMGALGFEVPTYPSSRYASSLFWIVGGLVLTLISKPLGRVLGHGLD